VNGPDVMQIYRDRFQPSDHFAEAAGSISAFVICAETEEEADAQAKSRDLFRLRVETGRFLPYPSIEEAEAYDYSERERMRVAQNREALIVGTPDQVKNDLEKMAEQHGVNEIIVLTICHDFEGRRRSYELVAEAFGLEKRDV
jgi:alkanesulfonate monooxygenase SsuD/methylene tetrahydromethanopterin reductase-like flavin-dependent oxidoreductase (luciferase family)